MSSRTGETYRLKFVAAAVAACFASGAALANPTGPAVANGQVMFHQQGNLLQITNSPNAIINWQGFSIGANEITRFLQQSASSAVLNRVISQNPSSILGLLQSNGRVFLINPNGILFGPGSQVDVAGLVASSLNLSDADFLAGRLRFTEVPGAGSVINQGAINSASGGQVYLVGPAVTNEGVITSPQGEVILAAGNSVELVDPGTPNLRVGITAPDNEAVNLGQVVADSGRVGIYAGLVKQFGTIQANTAQVTEDGRIVLKATKGVTLEAGSMTAASGVKGGDVNVETETGTIRVSGKIDATGSEAGGSINLAVTGDSGGIDLGAGLNAGNAAVNLDGPGHTTTLNADMVTDGAPIFINDSVVLGAPATINLDTTNGGTNAGGANVTITGAVDDDAEASGLVLSAGTAGVNTVSGAIGGTTPIASLTISGSATFLNNGAVTTTGDQTYNSPATFTPGTLTINAGGDVAIGGNVFSGPQSISATGDITVTPAVPGSVSVSATGSQTVVAGGALNVTGAAIGSNRFAQLIASGDQNISASSIDITGGGGTGNFAQVRHMNGASGGQTLTVNGGDLVLAAGSGGANNRADIRGAADQSITVIGGGELSLQGGSAGANNQARIRHEASGGDQTINVAGGDIVISGGSSTGIPPDTGSNFARIENRGLGNQTVNADTITMAGGLSGDNNFAGLQAAHQLITTTGNVMLAGGTGSISGARIGAVSNLSDTDVTLNVGGSLALTGGGGSGASVGSNRLGGLSTDIAVTAAGDITLNPGPGSGARFGSPSANVAGGNIALTSGGNIALNSAGGVGTSIRTLGDVSLTANAITQGSDATIQANQLTTVTNSGTSLGGNNQVARFNASNLFGGDVLVNNTSPLLTVTGVNQTPFGLLTLTQDGDLTLTGGVFSGPQSISATGTISVLPSSPAIVNAAGPQSVSAGGGLVVQSSALGSAQVTANGGQTIDANYIEVTAQGGNGAFISNFIAGNQTITTHGANLAGEGVTVRSQGGFALIDQDAFGFAQSITANNADYVRVIGESGPARIESSFGGGAQTLALQGAGLNALEVGSTTATGSSEISGDIQTITAGLLGQQGSIALQGGVSGGGARARILGRQGQDIAAANIALAGGAGGTGNSADFLQTGGGFNQNVTVRDGGTLSLQGGGGTNNFARIRNNAGNQQINVAGGAILISGGDGPDVPSNPNDTANNYARIRSQAAGGVQTIIADTIMLAGGIAEASNFAGLQAANQFITASGDVTLQGGAGSNSGARIGGVSNITPTNVVLNVGGNLALNGGTGAGSSLGSNRFGNQPTDIAVNATGGITLNPGSGTGARIGSPSANVAGGDIVLTSGGNIALNSAGGIGTSIRTLDNVSLTANAIAQGDDSVIQADQLTVNVNTGADLDGANRVSAFNSMGGFLNGVKLNNGSPLLAVTGINTFGGPLTLTQDGDLTLTGGIFSGPQMVSATGDISVVPSSPAVVNASGPQTISAGGGLIVESSALGSAQVTANGGQTINSEYVEVTAQGGNGAFISNFVTGNQTITTHGTSAQGEGIAVRSQGGFALIDQDAFGFAQSITTNNADYVRVIGESGTARIESSFGGGTQTLVLQGAGLNALQVGSASGAGESSIVGGIQAVTAGLPGEQGSISLRGGAGGAGASALIMGTRGQNISAANIALTGGAGGTGNSADFLQTGGGFNQNFTVRNGGTLSLQGGGGTNNSARIRSDNGNQTILGSPVITVTGGTGSSSFAMIRTRNGTQTITAGDTSLMGGAGGFANFAVIQAPEQYITVHGDLSLTGRDSARNATGSSGVARMGGPGGSAARPTDLVLNVDGDVTLTGGNVEGAGAAIGSASGQNTDVVMTAGGNITLDPGTVTGASSRIGSQPGTSGNISLTSGGNIALNSNPGLGTFIRTLDKVTLNANAITQGDDAVIEANQLITTTAAGTSLGGKNQVAVFNAINGAIGSVMLNNASPSLMLSGISTNPMPFTLMQEGDLMVTGDVWSGPQTINVTGDMTVGAESNSVILYAAGPRRSMARGEPHASWKALGVGLLDRVAGHSPINISARSLSLRGGNGFGDFAMITGGPIKITTTGGIGTGDFSLAGGSGFGAFGWVLSSQDINLNIGGNLQLDSGTGFLSFARMQTVRPTSKINIFFPNLSSGGYFVNGIEGVYRKSLSGFYTGPHGAKPGKGLLVDYGI